MAQLRREGAPQPQRISDHTHASPLGLKNLKGLLVSWPPCLHLPPQHTGAGARQALTPASDRLRPLCPVGPDTPPGPVAGRRPSLSQPLRSCPRFLLRPDTGAFGVEHSQRHWGKHRSPVQPWRADCGGPAGEPCSGATQRAAARPALRSQRGLSGPQPPTLRPGPPRCPATGAPGARGEARATISDSASQKRPPRRCPAMPSPRGRRCWPAGHTSVSAASSTCKQAQASSGATRGRVQGWGADTPSGFAPAPRPDPSKPRHGAA